MLTSWTWREIVDQALTDSGLVGKNQPVKDTERQIGERLLSFLLDELDGEGIALPSYDQQIIFNTVGGQAKYLLGPDSNPPFTDASPASTFRPESIITGNATISTNPNVDIALYEIDFPNYTNISVKSTQSQPYNYALNPTWPQAELYLYPTPDRVYPISLFCKVKWQFTQTGTTEVGAPVENPTNVAQLPSGFSNALKDCLAFKIAKSYELETEQLRLSANQGKFLMASRVMNQNTPDWNKSPRGVFPWNIGISGRNP